MTAHQSFHKHLRQHQADLRAFIGSLVTDVARREDVFQETALTLWQKYPDYDHSRSFGAWARGVAAKKILHAKRQDQRFPTPFDPETIEHIAQGFEDIDTEAAASVHERGLQHCLKKLPDEAHALLVARYEQGLSGEVLARKQGCSLQALYKQLSRIRQQLGTCIESYARHFENFPRS